MSGGIPRDLPNPPSYLRPIVPNVADNEDPAVAAGIYAGTVGELNRRVIRGRAAWVTMQKEFAIAPGEAK